MGDLWYLAVQAPALLLEVTESRRNVFTRSLSFGFRKVVCVVVRPVVCDILLVRQVNGVGRSKSFRLVLLGGRRRIGTVSLAFALLYYSLDVKLNVSEPIFCDPYRKYWMQ